MTTSQARAFARGVSLRSLGRKGVTQNSQMPFRRARPLLPSYLAHRCRRRAARGAPALARVCMRRGRRVKTNDVCPLNKQSCTLPKRGLCFSCIMTVECDVRARWLGSDGTRVGRRTRVGQAVTASPRRRPHGGGDRLLPRRRPQAVTASPRPSPPRAEAATGG